MFYLLTLCTIALCTLYTIFKSKHHWNFLWQKLFHNKIKKKNGIYEKIQNYKRLSLRVIHDLSATLEDNNLKSEQYIAFLPLIVDLRRQGERLMISMESGRNHSVFCETQGFVSRLISLENGLKKLRAESMRMMEF